MLEQKNPANKHAPRSDGRSARKNNFTGPTLLEMFG